jgi:hypothetical protein
MELDAPLSSNSMSNEPHPPTDQRSHDHSEADAWLAAVAAFTGQSIEEIRQQTQCVHEIEVLCEASKSRKKVKICMIQ